MSGAIKIKTTKIQRMLNDNHVKVVLYDGKHVGHGKYLAGEVNGKLVCDENGKPLPLRSVGKLTAIQPAK